MSLFKTEIAIAGESITKNATTVGFIAAPSEIGE
jgi:hypothetical protein